MVGHVWTSSRGLELSLENFNGQCRKQNTPSFHKMYVVNYNHQTLLWQVLDFIMYFKVCFRFTHNIIFWVRTTVRLFFSIHKVQFNNDLEILIFPHLRTVPLTLVWLEIFHWQFKFLSQFAILRLKYFKLKNLMA